MAHACNPSTWETESGGFGVQSLSWLHRKFKCSLGHTRPRLNVKQTSQVIKGGTTCRRCPHPLILETLNVLGTEVPCPASTLSTGWLFSPCTRNSSAHSHEATETQAFNTDFTTASGTWPCILNRPTHPFQHIPLHGLSPHNTQGWGAVKEKEATIIRKHWLRCVRKVTVNQRL